MNASAESMQRESRSVYSKHTGLDDGLPVSASGLTCIEAEYQENDNFGSDAAFQATIERLINKNKIIELEVLDPQAIRQRPVFRFIKRAFDIVSCSCALVVCAIPMLVIAIAIKRDSPGPIFYKQERLGWSIIGQKSGAAFGMASRPALSALEALFANHLRTCLEVVV